MAYNFDDSLKIDNGFDVLLQNFFSFSGGYKLKREINVKELRLFSLKFEQ